MELLTDLLPLVGGGVFGAVIRLWSNSQQAKADAHKRTMDVLVANQGGIQTANEMAEKSSGFSWTRRFIVVAVTSVVVGAFWSSTPITVATTVVEGGSYLFGLIDTTTENIVYQTLEEGKVVLPVIIPSFQAIIGTYMGSSIVGKVR